MTPSAAFMVVGSQVRDLSPAQRASSDAALKHDFLSVLRHINDPKYVFSATGKEKLGDSEATVVDVNADGVSTQWWIAPDGKLLQERFSDTGEKGPTTLTMKYSDWKSFDGLRYPTKYAVSGDTDQPAVDHDAGCDAGKCSGGSEALPETLSDRFSRCSHDGARQPLVNFPHHPDDFSRADEAAQFVLARGSPAAAHSRRAGLRTRQFCRRIT